MNGEPNHQHTEAFWLMTYICQDCGHKEVIWNSRDGVTPFGTRCMACGGINMLHKGPHEYAPDHVPDVGQYVWITFPESLRLPFGRGRVKAGEGTAYQVDDPQTRQEIAEGIADDMQAGEPFLIQWFPLPMGREQHLLQQELQAIYACIYHYAPKDFPLMEYDSGAEALAFLLDTQLRERLKVADLPDALAITNHLISAWMRDTQGMPITISVTALGLAVIDAISRAVDTAYLKGQTDGVTDE